MAHICWITFLPPLWRYTLWQKQMPQSLPLHEALLGKPPECSKKSLKIAFTMPQRQPDIRVHGLHSHRELNPYAYFNIMAAERRTRKQFLPICSLQEHRKTLFTRKILPEITAHSNGLPLKHSRIYSHKSWIRDLFFIQTENISCTRTAEGAGRRQCRSLKETFCSKGGGAGGARALEVGEVETVFSLRACV